VRIRGGTEGGDEGRKGEVGRKSGCGEGGCVSGSLKALRSGAVGSAR
jgi:hypothetical protein